MSLSHYRVATLLIVLSISSITVSTQQAPSPYRDGTWWLSLSSGDPKSAEIERATKKIYVAGMIDSSETLLVVLSKDQQAYQATMARFFPSVRDAQQIADGIDEYYKDFTRRHDLVGVAFFSVCKQIREKEKR